MPVMPVVHKVKGFKEYMGRDKSIILPISNSTENLVPELKSSVENVVPVESSHKTLDPTSDRLPLLSVVKFA